MSDQDTAEVAAALTADILGDFVQNHGDENAARMLGEMGVQPDVAPPAPQPVVSSPPPAAPAADTPAPETPEAETEPEAEAEAPEPPTFNFDPLPDDELDRLLEEPDFDEEAREEVAAKFDAGDLSEDDDPEAMARDRAKDKRIEYLEQRLVRSERHKWVEENLRKYPVLKDYAADDVRAFESTSRRAFAREAKALNDKLTAMLKPALDDIAAYRAQVQGEAEKAARVKAAEQWGLPALEPAGAAPPSTETERKLAAAREQRAPLAERIKIMMSGGR